MADWPPQILYFNGARLSHEVHVSSVAFAGGIAYRLDAPITTPRRMPDEIVAWPAEVYPSGELALTGGWSARRHYTDETTQYLRADRIDVDVIEQAIRDRMEDTNDPRLWAEYVRDCLTQKS